MKIKPIETKEIETICKTVIFSLKPSIKETTINAQSEVIKAQNIGMFFYLVSYFLTFPLTESKR